jgi:hypothetical protein
MNANTQFERDLEQWLQAEAPPSAPAGFHATVMDRARTLRQRPGWATTLPARRSGRVRSMTLLAAAALLLVGGALAAGSGLFRLPTVVPPVPEPSVVAVATASPDATSPSPTEPATPSASPIPVAGPGGVWIPTGSMGTPRHSHSAVRLQDGRVLVVGGFSDAADYEEGLTSAELYDPATGTWSAAGSISEPVFENAAALLGDGTVLVLVGHDDGGPRSAEVYDPRTGTWTATGPMGPGLGDSRGALTVLRDGRVLLTGWDGAQVYDPALGTWTATGPMIERSIGDTFTVLRDGRVLDWGGRQVYDPASGSWTATGEKKGEASGAAALLSDGKVLVAGGRGFTLATGDYDLGSAEVYDPATGSWTAIADMSTKGEPLAAFLQPDGKVLVVGRTVEVYDPATGTWTAHPLKPGIEYNAATLLSDGAVLVTGHRGFDQPACDATALYDPHTASSTTASTMNVCARDHSLTLLLDGTVLVAGGWRCNGDGGCVSTDTAELYVPAGVSPPPLPAFPGPPPIVIPSPTPSPSPLPPADGPVPPNARSWTVTVDNQSSKPATLFVADDGRLVGSATPNVVPPGTAMEVTFGFPADDDGWINVNPRPGDEGGLVNADQIGIPGKIVITADGQVVWASP